MKRTDPAYPVVVPLSGDALDRGMDIRTKAALAALGGMELPLLPDSKDLRIAAKSAINYADALMDELEKDAND